MKIQWSVFFSFLLLLTLVSCGSEEFGTAPQSTQSNPDGLKAFQQLSCTSHTLIKPKVDILYVVDNSGSAFYLPDQIKTAVSNTVNTVSTQFDYRIIGTPLIPDATPYNDYQVLTNSTDALPDSSKKIISASELSFFSSPGANNESEKGLGRTINFINNTGSLFRSNAYLLVVLVSNGRDMEVETDNLGDGNTQQNTTLFNSRVSAFNAITTRLNLSELRFYSVTAKTSSCYPEWRRSTYSYIAMASALSNGMSYDLCTNSVANIFSSVNSSIQQQVIPHQYRYWPITFAENNESVSLSEIQVYKVSGNQSPVLMPSSAWTYYRSNQGYEDTREEPNLGERVYGTHFIKFNSLLQYPDCVQVKSVSRTEYFGWIVLPKEPKLTDMYVTINGVSIPQSSTNGWSYRGNMTVSNIKMPYPAAGDELPAISKSGFMVQLNGPSNYYKSGDSVQVNYVPQGI